MANYLVTGGAGFIGSHLCDALIKEHKVYVLDNLSSGSMDNLPAGIEFIEGDVRDYSLLEGIMEKVDGCFHLAAIVSIPQCNEDFLNSHSVNLTGTLNILESTHALKNSKSIPIVFASSCAIYGDNHNLPIKETEQPKPISFYAELKLAAEYYGRFACEVNQSVFTALRLFNVYGNRQKPDSQYSGVISIFLKNFLKDKPCIYFGDGTQTRDFVYVKDVVRFFIQAMNTSTPAMRTFNVCTGKSTQVKDLATLLSQITKKKLQVDVQAAKIGDIYQSLGNPLFACNELGIKAKIPIEMGLHELVSTTLKDLH